MPLSLDFQPLAIRRLGAATVDGLLALLVAFVISLPGSGPFKAHLFGVGLLLAGAFVLLRDSLSSVFPKTFSELQNRSPGKSVLGLFVWPGSDDALALSGSLKRNLTLAAPILVWGVTRTLSGYAGLPYWSWVLNLTILLVLVEMALAFFDPEGQRLGDRWAGTQVYEG